MPPLTKRREVAERRGRMEAAERRGKRANTHAHTLCQFHMHARTHAHRETTQGRTYKLPLPHMCRRPHLRARAYAHTQNERTQRGREGPDVVDCACGEGGVNSGEVKEGVGTGLWGHDHQNSSGLVLTHGLYDGCPLPRC